MSFTSLDKALLDRSVKFTLDMASKHKAANTINGAWTNSAEGKTAKRRYDALARDAADLKSLSQRMINEAGDSSVEKYVKIMVNGKNGQVTFISRPVAIDLKGCETNTDQSGASSNVSLAGSFKPITEAPAGVVKESTIGTLLKVGEGMEDAKTGQSLPNSLPSSEPPPNWSWQQDAAAIGQEMDAGGHVIDKDHPQHEEFEQMDQVRHD